MKPSRKSSPRSKSGARDARDLRRAFHKKLRRIARRAARNSGGGDVHAVRKGITKLRSWLRLARALIGPRRFRKHNRRLRKAARALAPVRDACVMRAAFERIGSAMSFPDTDKHLKKRARRAKQAGKAAMRKTKRCLEQELAASDRLPLGKKAGADFDAALERMRQEMAAAFTAARASGSTEARHTWRKRTKNYLHALAFVAGKNDPNYQPAACINRILGKDHDLALLAAELDARSDKPESAAQLVLIARRRAKLRRKLFPK